MEFDVRKYTYPSHRNVVYGRHAMACTSVPMAPQIGIDVMRHGGNAIDAAIAMAATMPLLEPTGNALGSDCFALVWIEKEKKLYGLNASGISPAALDYKKVKAMGFDAIPKTGWLTCMVPGAPSGWAKLRERFGTKSFDELFSYAIDYARNGCPVSVNLERQWANDSKRFIDEVKVNPAPYKYWCEKFLKDDMTPYKAGDLFKFPEYADSLEELAKTNCESYYRGDLMKKIVEFSKKTGGYFCEEDFKQYNAEWVEPISVNYKGYTVCEIPPNGHGITVLMALNFLKGLKMPENRDSDLFYHYIIESIKLAYADTKRYVADPRYMRTKVSDMLSEKYADIRRSLIGEKAIKPTFGDPSCGGTIYLCTADQYGNMVSFIQSNYNIFGSGIAIPGTGISLNNRGKDFSLDPEMDNCLLPNKKCYHTIIPGFLLKDNEAVGPFGVMGAYMQPQGHVQVLVNSIDYHMNPQQALDAPRVQWTGDMHVQLEKEIDSSIAKKISDRGHEVEILESNLTMGRGEIIWKTDNGMYVGGSESRADGTVASW